MLFSLWSPADMAVMFNTFAELLGKGGWCSPTLRGTFSTDLDVSAVYQVKTQERTQAGNLNEKACLTTEGKSLHNLISHYSKKKKKRVGVKE